MNISRFYKEITFDLTRLNMFNTTSNYNLEYSHKAKPMEVNISSFGYDSQFSAVGFKLILKRYFNKHFLNYYVPSSTFVVVSWASFIIPPDVIPGRMGLLITLLLVLVNLFGTVISTQPPTNTPTMLAIWILICTLFVKAAFFAYAILLYKLNSIPKNSTIKDNKTRPNQTNHIATKNVTEIIIDPRLKNWDKNCLILFPLAFLIFNLIYWPIAVALHRSGENEY